MDRTVAALFVDPRGIYSKLEGVIPWGLPERDAREYGDSFPVVAHPPCATWGRFAHFAKSAEGGCFASALASVERCGGVLEHPRDSRAFEANRLGRPTRGCWSFARQGWITEVDQRRYGHRAIKSTWLYYVGDAPPSTRLAQISSTSEPDSGWAQARREDGTRN